MDSPHSPEARTPPPGSANYAYSFFPSQAEKVPNTMRLQTAQTAHARATRRSVAQNNEQSFPHRLDLRRCENWKVRGQYRQAQRTIAMVRRSGPRVRPVRRARFFRAAESPDEAGHSRT